jgi:hypothetical protein
MAPGVEVDNFGKFDAELGRVQELPTAKNNDGNLFIPQTNNKYVEAVEKLKKEGKVSAQRQPLQLL